MTETTKFRNGSRDPHHAYLWDSNCKANTLHDQVVYKIKVSGFSRSRDISGGVKFQNGPRDPNYAPFRHLCHNGWTYHEAIIAQ